MRESLEGGGVSPVVAQMTLLNLEQLRVWEKPKPEVGKKCRRKHLNGVCKADRECINVLLARHVKSVAHRQNKLMAVPKQTWKQHQGTNKKKQQSHCRYLFWGQETPGWLNHHKVIMHGSRLGKVLGRTGKVQPQLGNESTSKGLNQAYIWGEVWES